MKRVVLPDPLGPIRPTTSPSRISKFEARDRHEAPEPLGDLLPVQHHDSETSSAAMRIRRRRRKNSMIPLGMKMMTTINKSP